jgi:hypothetical protein
MTTKVAGSKGAVLNITASAVVQGHAARLARISVLTAGSGAGAAHDCATTGAAAAGNKVATIPTTAGAVLDLDWPCATGIVIIPGSGQVLSVSYL